MIKTDHLGDLSFQPLADMPTLFLMTHWSESFDYLICVPHFLVSLFSNFFEKSNQILS